MRGGGDPLRYVAVAPRPNATLIVEVALKPPQYRFRQPLAVLDHVAKLELSTLAHQVSEAPESAPRATREYNDRMPLVWRGGGATQCDRRSANSCAV